MQPNVPLISAVFAAGTLTGAAAVAGYLAIAEPASAPPVAVDTAPAIAAQAPDLVLMANTPGEAVGTAPPSEVQKTTRQEPAPASAQELRQVQEQLNSLSVRLATLEQTLPKALSARTSPASTTDSSRPQAPITAQERQSALITAGVEPTLAEDLILREGQRSLEQLALRDQAIREGWMGTDQYREEMARINADARSLREEIGDEDYDRYLYATGEDNRVAVGAVIPGSAAEIAGLQSGDVIESYADERLFEFAELRSKTTEGEYGESVAVRVRRGNSVIETWVPRGPLGVTLDSARLMPGP